MGGLHLCVPVLVFQCQEQNMHSCDVTHTFGQAGANGRTWVFGESEGLIRTCTCTRNVLGKTSSSPKPRSYLHYAHVTGACSRVGLDGTRGLPRSCNSTLTKLGNATYAPCYLCFHTIMHDVGVDRSS